MECGWILAGRRQQLLLSTSWAAFGLALIKKQRRNGDDDDKVIKSRRTNRKHKAMEFSDKMTKMLSLGVKQDNFS